VLARRERRQGDLGVRVTGRADVDEVDIVAFDEPTPVGLDGLPAVALGRSTHTLLVTAADRSQLGGQRQIEEPMSRAPGVRVRGAHEGVPHHSDP
jgi:hypothetical protein